MHHREANMTRRWRHEVGSWAALLTRQEMWHGARDLEANGQFAQRQPAAAPRQYTIHHFDVDVADQGDSATYGLCTETKDSF